MKAKYIYYKWQPKNDPNSFHECIIKCGTRLFYHRYGSDLIWRGLMRHSSQEEDFNEETLNGMGGLVKESVILYYNETDFLCDWFNMMLSFDGKFSQDD